MPLRSEPGYSAGYLGTLYGTGSDGAGGFSSGTNTLLTSKYYTTLDLSGSATLNTDGYAIYAQRYIKLRSTSKIINDGLPGSSVAINGGSGGSLIRPLGAGSTGGAGNAASGGGQAGTSSSPVALGGSGGAGALGQTASQPGGAGGAASMNTGMIYGIAQLLACGIAVGYSSASYGTFRIQGGGGGGGAGAYPSIPEIGSGGGAGGGVIVLCAPVIDIGSGTLVGARGGAGGDMSASQGSSGGGGGGGVIILICNVLIENGTISAVGGTGGSSLGSAGATGGTGTIIRYLNA